MKQINKLSNGPQLRITSVLVVHLLLIHLHRGQSKLIGSSQPILAIVGDDIILPCHLEPAVDVAAKTLEWTRSDLEPRFVLVWRASQDVLNVKNPSYRGRTSLFTDELKQGNISLKLSEVKPADQGRYRCCIPENDEEYLVELVVASDAAASPVISLTGIDGDKGGVVLQCESKGWYPEPELLWLDAEGKILSARPTETVRGPDDLYTVSSRVTVEKRHSNNITCRVQQSKINQTRETQIHILDDFFKVQSSSSHLKAGFAVIFVVCIILLIVLVFFVWKWKQNKSDKEIKNHSKTQKPEEQREGEQLMTNETVLIEVLDNGQKKIKNKHIVRKPPAPAGTSSSLEKFIRVSRQMLEEKQRREEAEKEVQTLKEQLGNSRPPPPAYTVNQLKTEVQKLKEEKQRSEDQRQQLEKKLETKKQEVHDLVKKQIQTVEKKMKENESKVETIMTLLRDQNKKIQVEKENMKEAETKKKQLENKITEFNRQLQNKKLNRKDAERKITKVNEKLRAEEKMMKEAETKVETLKKQGDTIKTELDQLFQAQEDNKKAAKTLKTLLKEEGSVCNSFERKPETTFNQTYFEWSHCQF
uniref:Ig-like domain-containing protein n=1 Tax=Anabas testudineus TaxID=64144 RepID=A0A7N6FC92_ANATE